MKENIAKNQIKTVNEEVNKGLLVCACESVYFILNIDKV
jgi:hypothetical protein